MNRYETKTPRAAFGFAALAMTAITFGLAVYVPAGMDATNDEFRTLAAAKVVAPAAKEGTAILAPVEVAGVRDPELASARFPDGPGRSRRHG
jgi:hypothetical protein